MGIKELSVRAQSLWAKKENKEGQELWLPLIAHLIDTKNVINWLYQNWLDANQQRIIQQDLTDDEVESLVKFVGYFHDIGKATPAFQTKASYNGDHELDNVLMEKLLRTGFNRLNEFSPASRRKSPHALAGETIMEQAGLDPTVGAIIGAHHGKPVDEYFNFRRQYSTYRENYIQSDKDKKLEEPWENVQQELIEYGLNLVGYLDIHEVPKVTQAQAIILTGLLIMADWLASSEYLGNDHSIPLFPLIRLDQNFSDLNMRERYQNAIIQWDVSDHWTPRAVVNSAEHYQKRWGFKPRVVQKLMSESIGKILDPGMLIIEAPTGIGKSEIAMTAVEQLASRCGTTGLFMGLPTQATNNAMFSRIDKWVNSLAKEDNEKLAIKLMHSKAQFNKADCKK
ncbi:CRISPR-associated endonuclease Cas3'' [Limosilactobacillus kribbianus]|uniref:CRISPR-associated endonuclease Cas3'' n=1 Tax=Limosilactobacillus kribbianus TaxID=2982695 RepID=UPI002264BD74|nr:CRISPR-associated endonuclease Cas3'' [Limosilactobacillus kribbianus]